MTTKSRDGASIHGIHLDVRSGSIGVAGGDGGNSLSRRQQHVREPAVSRQQHWPEVAHVCFDFTPSRFTQEPLALETGVNPDAMIAVSKPNVAKTFGVLCNLYMACVPRQSIYIVRWCAATVHSRLHLPYG
jgi:hypothetical protein